MAPDDDEAVSGSGWRHPEPVWPWRFRPSGTVAATLRFNDDEKAVAKACRDYGIHLPPRIAHSALRRRADHVAGRACAARALDMLGLSDRAPPGMQQDGSPAWSSDVVGSITHAGRRALAVVASSDRFLAAGVDYESWLAHDVAEGINREICLPCEVRVLGRPLNRAVTAIFSLKEALMKAFYPLTGMMPDFLDIEVAGIDSDGLITAKLKKGIGSDWHAGSRISTHSHEDQEGVFSLVLINKR